MTVVQFNAQSNQSLMILAWDGPNFGLPTLVGVAPGLSLNLWAPTCLSGFGSSLVFLDIRFGPSLRKKSGLFLGFEKWGIYARTRLGIVLGTPVIYNAPYKSHPMHKENKFRQY